MCLNKNLFVCCPISFLLFQGIDRFSNRMTSFTAREFLGFRAVLFAPLWVAGGFGFFINCHGKNVYSSMFYPKTGNYSSIFYPKSFDYSSLFCNLCARKFQIIWHIIQD